jgi:molybdopterin molybdotransferase
MLTIEQALERCLAAALPVCPERVLVAHALGRVLAGDVIAPVDLPPWDNSAMDGFAVRSHEAIRGASLEVGETIAAGAVARNALAAGGAMRIMTGAPLPADADSIVMIEDTSIEASRVRIGVDVRAGEHVRTARRGHSRRLDGARVGRDALGSAHRLVRGARARRRVVREASDRRRSFPRATRSPRPARRSVRADLLVEQRDARGAGGDERCRAGRCAASRATIATPSARPSSAAAAADLIVTTGGVSVGDFDLVKDVLGEQIEFWKVRMKPGKPLAVGRFAGARFFGLPGNPVSAFVNFHEFVRPVIRRSLGDPRPFLPRARRGARHRGQEGRRTRGARPRRTLVGRRAACMPRDDARSGLAHAHEHRGRQRLRARSPPIEPVSRPARRSPCRSTIPTFLKAEQPGYRW